MTRDQMQADMERMAGEARAMLGDESKADAFKALHEKINACGEQIRAMDKADAELRALKDAEQNVPAPKIIERSGWAGVRSAFKAAIDRGQRANIDISGLSETRAWAGAQTGTQPGLIRALIDGGRLRKLCNIALGKNAVTVVPALTTTPAIPVGTAPGATGTSSDSAAVFAGDSMTLKPWYSTLAIPMSVLMGDIEGELPSLFADNFGAAIDKMVCVGAGSGSDGLGVFIASVVGVPTGSDITATGSGAAPVWADYIGMALQLLSLSGDMGSLAIVVHPSVFATALGVATGSDPNKVEYLTKGTILGIPVILSSYGLTTLTSGSYVAVGGYFKHYTVAIAQEITVDQIKTVGSDNVTFQAFMYMQGKPTIGSSFRRLKTG